MAFKKDKVSFFLSSLSSSLSPSPLSPSLYLSENRAHTEENWGWGREHILWENGQEVTLHQELDLPLPGLWTSQLPEL